MRRCAPNCSTRIERPCSRRRSRRSSDPIRLRLLSYIAASDADEVCACDLVEPSGRSQPTVSHHMKILVDAGLVEREKRGLWVWYRLVPSRLDALRAVLA